MLILKEAVKIADYLIAEFQPYCERIEVGGSVRRRKPHVNDIELIAIPIYNYQGTLFGGTIAVDNELRPVVERMATRINKQGKKYIQFILDGVFGDFLLKEVKVDLFLSTDENFGLNFLIRTGSAEFSQSVLAYANSKGYHSEGSIFHDGEGHSFPMKEETDVFKFLELPFIEPVERQSPLDYKLVIDANNLKDVK